jgi:hypothetical protein
MLDLTDVVNRPVISSLVFPEDLSYTVSDLAATAIANTIPALPRRGKAADNKECTIQSFFSRTHSPHGEPHPC